MSNELSDNYYESVESTSEERIQKRKFRRLLLLTFVSFLLWVVMWYGAYISNSRGLACEVLFFFIDFVGYLLQTITLGLNAYVRKRSFTFGYQRIEPLISLFLALTISPIGFKILIMSIQSNIENLVYVEHNLLLLFGAIAFCSRFVLALILTGNKNKSRLLLVLLLINEVDDSFEINEKETQVKGSCLCSFTLIIFGIMMRFGFFDFFEIILISTLLPTFIKMSTTMFTNSLALLMSGVPKRKLKRFSSS